jgi:hypothetical protein
MITRLRAENFKSWKDTGDLRLGRLTGLFGTNSSGKTGILQILPLLKQTAEFPDRSKVLNTGNRDSPVYLGTFQEIIHGRRPEAALRLSFTWRNKEPLAMMYRGTLSDGTLGEREISFRTSIIRKDDAPVVNFFEYELPREIFGMHRKEGGSYELVYRREALSPEELQIGSRDSDSIGTGEGLRISPVAPPVKCYGFPENASLRLPGSRDRLPELQLAFVDLFERVHYLGPLRSFPERAYEWGGDKPLDTGWDGDQAVPALLAWKKEEQVARWLQQMGLIDSFRLEPVDEPATIFKCWVRATETATEVLLPDVGFGVSQILPVLANCAVLPEDSTLLLEQPEIHLHPFAQAALADVLIDAVKNRNIQIIVESHSEHILRRIQRRIAREVLSSEDTALYFCSFENGASTIEELEVDSYGNIKNWPKHFFGDEMGELADMTIAAMERQKAGSK